MSGKEFKEQLAKTIAEFHDFQIENDIPYGYDTIGLQEWLLFNNGLDLSEGKD